MISPDDLCLAGRALANSCPVIEFEYTTAVGSESHGRILLPISSILSIESWPEASEARVTLLNDRVLWATEGYAALVARLREDAAHT